MPRTAAMLNSCASTMAKLIRPNASGPSSRAETRAATYINAPATTPPTNDRLTATRQLVESAHVPGRAETRRQYAARMTLRADIAAGGAVTSCWIRDSSRAARARHCAASGLTRRRRATRSGEWVRSQPHERSFDTGPPLTDRHRQQERLGDDDGGQHPQQQRQGVRREHRDQPVAFEQVHLARVLGERVGVPGHGVGDVDHLKAGEATTQAQVRVLVIEEVGRVEPAELVPHGAAHREQRTADRGHLATFPVPVHVVTVATRPADPEVVDRVSGRVDHLGVVGHDDEAGDQPDRGLARLGAQDVEGTGCHDGVGVDEHDHVTVGGVDPEVAARGEAARCGQR